MKDFNLVNMIYLVVILVVIPSILCESVVLLNLKPEEAQQYLASRSLDLEYAPEIGTQAGTSGKQFYYKGKLVDNQGDFTEKVYNANQFHGQDGLGRAMFGYKDWNQGRLEARNANGEVRGSYQYVDPNGENVIVNYWSDSLGFHQMDNIPRLLLDPVTETPEVQSAREAHQKAWESAARAARENPDPMSDVYNRNANRLDEDQAIVDQAREIIHSSNNQGLNRYPHLPYNKHIKPDDRQPLSEDTVIIEVLPQESRTINKYEKSESEPEEITSDPKGFFYNFDYPVNVILPVEFGRKINTVHQGGPKTKRNDEIIDLRVQDTTNIEPLTKKDTTVVPDEDTLITEIKSVETDKSFETEKTGNNQLKSSQEDTIPVEIKIEHPIIIRDAPLLKSQSELKLLATDPDRIDAVHDTQINPKVQK